MSKLNLSALKKSSAKDLMAKLQKGVEESAAGKKKDKDERFWYPEVGADGNGSAVIRFLPAKTEDSYPFVKEYKHAFNENGMWFIAECPSAIGEPCPVCESNGAHWKSGIEADKEIARRRKRGLKYIANVLVVKDPAHPENEGQVRLWRFGKKIFDKIEECFKVDADLGEEAINPFGFFDGANFAIKIQTVADFINFDKSKFIKAPDLFGGDEEKLTALMESMFDLAEFTDPSRFKSYEDLKARFLKVTTGVDQVAKKNEEEFNSNDAPAAPTERFESAAKTETASAPAAEDDDLAFFQNLVNS